MAKFTAIMELKELLDCHRQVADCVKMGKFNLTFCHGSILRLLLLLRSDREVSELVPNFLWGF